MISAALGVYVQAVIEFASTKVPVPFEVHKTEAPVDALAPVVILIADPELQVTMFEPAVADGELYALITTVLFDVIVVEQ